MSHGTDSEPLARRGRLARLRRGLLASALALLVAFALVEALARMRFGTPLAERLPICRVEANPHRGWQMVPGETHYTYLHEVHINALGLRGPEVLPKAEGERRVLALGDSLIYGQGVADDQTLPFHLELFLNERDGDRPWTVINAGHRAYDTRQELGLLEELGDQLRPDVVVVFWYWNDVKERDIDGTFRNLSESGPIAFDTGAAMEGWTKTKWQLKQLVRRSALIMTAHDKRKNRAGDPTPPDFLDNAMKRLDGYLVRFQELSARDGFDLVFALVPDANGLVGPYLSLEITDRARRVAEERGVRICLLRPALEGLLKDLGELPVLPYDGHYTAAGNRAMAEAAAAALLSMD
ncbi:MAG: SGNH/GDSL hydrolase family protein [Planctomycetota bacterium]